MTLSKSHVNLIIILVFLKNLIYYHTQVKFHSQDLPSSGFLTGAPKGYLMSKKISRSWLG